MPIGATIGAAVVGAGANLVGGQMQASATKNASQQQQQMFNTTRNDLLPYNTAGQNATELLTHGLGDFTQPITMDQATLEKTPGYQFNLLQGLKATQNAAAARGLGSSGAALKGAAAYATGLADSTYKTQFDIANTNQTNAYNRLMGIATLGQNAAAQTGALGTQTATNIGNNTIAGGTAQAAGFTGAGNALMNGANAYAGLNRYQQQAGMYTPGNGYQTPALRVGYQAGV